MIPGIQMTIATVSDAEVSLRFSRGVSANNDRLAPRYRDIGDPKLHPLCALVAVDGKGSRDMQRLAAVVGERAAEFLADRAKRDAIDDSAVARFQPNAQM